MDSPDVSTTGFTGTELIPELQRNEVLLMLPSLPTRIVKFELVTDIEHAFCLYLRTTVEDKEEALQWKQCFEVNSGTTFNVDSTFKENSQKIVFKREYHCMNNTRPSSRKVKHPHEKHVNCRAKLTITVKNPNMRRSKDVYLREYPCEIFIRHVHNHDLRAPDALLYNKPSIQTEKIFKRLLNTGLTPAVALEKYKLDLQEEFDIDYFRVIADGSRCPTQRWCYELYYKMFKRENEKIVTSELLADLQRSIDKYNDDCRDSCAGISNNNGEFIVAIVSPIMKKIHRHVKTCSEIVFMNSFECLDRHSSKIYSLACQSVVGELPLGILMTNSENERVMTKGLEIFKNLLNTDGFLKTGSPKVIITNECPLAKPALKSIFPGSEVWLSIVSILQFLMRYLCDSKHEIRKDDRICLYKTFHDLFYSEEESTFREIYTEYVVSDVAKKYYYLQQCVENFISKKQELALFYKLETIIEHEHPNNIYIANFRAIKDKILQSTRGFNAVRLFDYLTKNLEKYFERKLVALSKNQSEDICKRYYIQECEVKILDYIDFGNGIFRVNSPTNEYIVDHTTEICSCYLGSEGDFCKHQLGVVRHFNLCSSQLNSASEKLLDLILCNQDPLSYSLLQGIKPEVKIEELECGNTDDIQTASERLRQNCEKLQQKLVENPNLFYKPIKKLNEVFDNIQSDTVLISALSNFGRCTDPVMQLASKKKKSGKIEKETNVIRRKRNIEIDESDNSYRIKRLLNEWKKTPVTYV